MKCRKFLAILVILLLTLTGSACAKSIPFLGLIPEPLNFSKLTLPEKEFTDSAIRASRYVPEDFVSSERAGVQAGILDEYPDYENSQLPLIRHQNP